VDVAEARRRAWIIGALATLALAGCEAPAPITAVPPSAPGDEEFSDPQLAQLLAPVALYPDELLAQVLMASTYPLEVVQAQRWVARDGNAALRGEALAQALDAQPWDVSVKSLVPFPDVLNLMADRLEWTQALGDAVLARPEAVLSSVQTLRRRAQASGSLTSTPQQTVSTGQSIIIEPAQPDVVYVPVYDPSYVYGAWPYPAYPPYYWGGALATGLAFAAGVAIVAGFWGWARPGWGGGDINIDVNRTRNVNIDRDRLQSGRWQHRPEHRGGVAYRGDAVRSRYQGSRPARTPSDSARGRAGAGTGDSSAPGFSGVGRGSETRTAASRGMASRAAPASPGASGLGGAPRGSYGGGRSAGGFGGGARGGRGGRR
jgi:hypothetical protein